MKKSLLALATVLAIVAGCAKENLSGSRRTHTGIKEITATIANPDDTKAYLANDEGVMKFYWYADEPIKVGAGDQWAEFTLTEGYDSPKGKFASDEDLPEADFWLAGSPADAIQSSSGDSLFVKYPATVTYNSLTAVAEGGEILAAKSEDTNFTFHNAISYIKFQLINKAGESDEIEYIEVSGKDGKNVAGDAKIVFNGTQIDTVRFISGGDNSTSIKVEFNEDITVGDSEPFVIYIPVTPMAKGVSINVVMKSGKAMNMTSSTPVDLGQILELPVIEFAPVVVAQVGDEQYYSIDKAVLEACELGEDATVTLLRDCIVGANCEVLSQNVITIDLNGKTLYSSGGNHFKVASGTKECIILDSSEEKTGKITNTNSGNSSMKTFGRLVLKSGTLVSESSYGLSINGGTAILEGGLVQGGSYGLYCKNDGDNKVDSVVVKGSAEIRSISSNGVYFNVIDGNLVFRGGTLQSQKAAVYLLDGNIKVYDGFLGAKSNVIYAHRSSSYNNQVDIYGGFFHRDSTTSSIVYGHESLDSTRVYGGYYNVGVVQTYIAEGYKAATCDTTVNGINFTQTIVKGEDVVATLKLGDSEPVEKATINDAFNAAMSSGQDAVITLVADCSPKDSMMVTNNKKLTIDFNGHELLFSDRRIFKVLGEESDVTFKSSVPGGGINQTANGTGRFCIRQDAGKVTIESGVYSSTLGQYGIYANGGTIDIKGGEFFADSTFLWVKGCTLNMTGGTFVKRESSFSNKKLVYITTDGIANITGGSFSSIYLYSGTCTANISGIICDSLTMGGGSSSTITFDGGTINGKTNITSNTIINDGSFNGRVDVSSTLTINGGTFTNNEGCALYNIEGGSTTIEGGTFNGNSGYGTIRSLGSVVVNDATVTSQNENNALYVGSDATSGSMTVNGGTFTGYKGIYVSNGSLAIAGGIFNTDQRAMKVAENGTAEVTGGYFNTPKDSVIFTGINAKGVAKGGWFKEQLPDSCVNSAFILDNTKDTTVAGVNYKYKVIENAGAPDVVSVNGVNYKAIDAAIAAAKTASAAGNVTFTLLEDCSTLTAIELTSANDFTIDLNGKSLTTQVVSSAANVKLTDNSTDANGSFNANSGKYCFTITGGTLTFDKGTINAPDYCAVLLNGSTDSKATFNMSGGTIVCTNTFADNDYVNNGVVAIINESEFNLSGGYINSPESSRGVYIKATSSSSTYKPTFNMTDGIVKAKSYAFYVYTRATANISGGTMLSLSTGSSAGICHNGTSNANVSVTVTGGYFYANGGRSFYCWSPSSYSNKFHVSGGYYNQDVKAKAASNFAYETGYEQVTVTPKESKVIDGTTYEFGYKVQAKAN